MHIAYIYIYNDVHNYVVLIILNFYFALVTMTLQEIHYKHLIRQKYINFNKLRSLNLNQEM